MTDNQPKDPKPTQEAMNAAGKIVDMMKGEGPIHNVNADSAFHSFASIITEETAEERGRLRKANAMLMTLIRFIGNECKASDRQWRLVSQFVEQAETIFSEVQEVQDVKD